MWRVYYSVLAAINPVARTVFRAYNNIAHQSRAKVLIQSPQGEILLVRNALGDRNWTLPGGGIERNEKAAQAAARELCEELGIDLEPRTLALLGSAARAGYDTVIFHVILSEPQIRSISRQKREIQAITWCDPVQLPIGTQHLVVDALNLLSARGNIGKII